MRAEAGILISESLRLTAVRMDFLLLNTSCLELGPGNFLQLSSLRSFGLRERTVEIFHYFFPFLPLCALHQDVAVLNPFAAQYTHSDDQCCKPATPS